MSTKRWTAVAAALAGVALYATVIEPRWLQLRRVRIHVHKLPEPLEGLRIALLTDLHAGGTTPLSLVRRAVRMTLEARPHLVAVTGDLAADDAPGFADVLDALDPLAAPLGVYAVPGNHDYEVGIHKWSRDLAAHPGIVDLTNRHVSLDLDGTRLCVAGVDDLYRGSPELRLPPPEERDVTVLLAHTPDQAERSRRALDAVDLILSGHTHSGQVRIPFLGAPLTAARHPELYQEGVRRRPWTQVYTSRGVGTVGLPVRFNARPEVSLLELTGAPRPPLGERGLRGVPDREAPSPPQRIPMLHTR